MSRKTSCVSGFRSGRSGGLERKVDFASSVVMLLAGPQCDIPVEGVCVL